MAILFIAASLTGIKNFFFERMSILFIPLFMFDHHRLVLNGNIN